MIKAYSYVRFSSDAQRLGHSKQRQLELARSYANDNNLELVETYQDLGVSAYRGSNATVGKLRDIKKAVESGKIKKGSYLLVENFDRLSRDQPIKAMQKFTELVECGLIIVTLVDGRVYNHENINETTNLLLSILTMIRANEESRTKGERLSKAWRNKINDARVNGKAITNQCPAWLRREGDNYTIIENNAEIVKRIFTLTSEGIGANTIVRELNSNGVKPFGRAKYWHVSYIRKMLNGKAVLGEMQPYISHYDKIKEGYKKVKDGEPIKNLYPPILTEEEYYKARAAIKNSSSRSKGRKGKAYSNLFSGLAICGNCGDTMYYLNKGKPPKGRIYYQCGNAMNKVGCTTPMHRYDAVEDGLLGLLSSEDYSYFLSENQISHDAIITKIEEEISKQEAIERKWTIAFEEDEEIHNIALMRLKEASSKIIKLKDELEKEKENQHSLNSPEKSTEFIAALLYKMYELEKYENTELKISMIREKLNSFFKHFISSIEFFDDSITVIWKNIGRESSYIISKKIRLKTNQIIYLWIDESHNITGLGISYIRALAHGEEITEEMKSAYDRMNISDFNFNTIEETE